MATCLHGADAIATQPDEVRSLTGLRVYCRREHVPDVSCGCRGGDCGDVDAEAASWRPPTLADERHDERHLLLLLHGAQFGSPQGWAC